MTKKKDLSALRIDSSKKAQIGNAGSGWKMAFFVLLVISLAAIGYLAWSPSQKGGPPSQTRTAADDASNGPAGQSGDSDQSRGNAPAPAREALVASGYVVAHHRISLGSKVTGKVSWIGVDKGDKVTKDQLLVKLDDREFRAQVEQARADLQTAKAALAEMEAGSRPEEIARSKSELERRQADASYAKLDWERLKSLLDSAVVSQQEVDNARTRYEMAQAAVEVARKDYELAKLGPRTEQIDRARSEVARAEANLEYHLALLDATEIRAPINGTVLQRIAEVGEMITTSFAGDQGAKSAVVALADLDDLQVELDINQSDFKKISRDHLCEMVPEAYPERTYTCEIAEIAPEADRQKATIQVKVQILQPDDYLRPDMDARVRFLHPDETGNRFETGRNPEAGQESGPLEEQPQVNGGE
ncbi:MAG TPA: efflux RND transporter periplasmic adaptor subunit [Acidobacteriota bacterium]|nr:efflux RND transporter periplasmic adaptor subunit [Acidobacteriota bacterium]